MRLVSLSHTSGPDAAVSVGATRSVHNIATKGHEMTDMIERGCWVPLGYERQALEEALTAVALGQPIDPNRILEALQNAIDFGLEAHNELEQSEYRLLQTRRKLRQCKRNLKRTNKNREGT